MVAMGRDLLYKPGVQWDPGDDSQAKPVKKGQDARTLQKTIDKATDVSKPGVRNLGEIGESVAKQIAEGLAKGGDAKPFRHSYFNKDISGAKSANFSASGMKALRGSNDATDLRKVVLPAAMGVEHPEPGVLRGAMDLMSADAGFAPDLASLLGRQGAWTKGKGVTAEMIQQRMAQLEAMVNDRKAALARMRGSSGSVTVGRAVNGNGGLPEDVTSAGNDLIRDTSAQAVGMHARLARMFGLKMQ